MLAKVTNYEFFNKLQFNKTLDRCAIKSLNVHILPAHKIHQHRVSLSHKVLINLSVYISLIFHILL